MAINKNLQKGFAVALLGLALVSGNANANALTPKEQELKELLFITAQAIDDLNAVKNMSKDEKIKFGYAVLLEQLAEDRKAKEDQICEEMSEVAKDAAKSSIESNMAADPSKIVQNTTCFTDVATVKIPIIMTGYGFIDKIIQSSLQKFMTGACGKAQDFMADLKTKAATEITKTAGAKASKLTMGYVDQIGDSAAQKGDSLLGEGFENVQKGYDGMMGS